MVDPRLDEIIDGVETIKTTAESKQDELVSGTNIKTINNQSVLGAGNLEVGGSITVDTQVNDSSTNPVENRAIADYVDSEISLVQDQVTTNTQNLINLETRKQNVLVSGTNIKTINEQSILGSGNLDVGSDITVDSTVDSLSDNPVENRAIYSFVTDVIGSVDDEINSINAKIPAQASSVNQLADKDFVNSSVSTATATFRGTFTSLSSLQESEGDRNDYAFYAHTDAAGNTIYDRYKYVGLSDARVPEGYTERLYLKKSRNTFPYFITNFKIQSTDKIEIKYYGGGYAALIGCLIGATDANNNYFSFEKGLNAIQFYLYNKNPNEISSYITIPKNYDTQFILEINDGKVYTKDINGDNTQLVGNFTLNSVDADLFIFAFNNNGQVAGRYSEEFNVGDVTIYDSNGEKRLELVPCTRISDSVNGYYDTVSKAFISPTDGVFTAQSLSTDKWAYEYSLNNSSFTADQWKAINSGLAQNVTSTGFDATATQVLKNVNGVIQWVTE